MGATTVTASLIFANYAVVNGNTAGWLSAANTQLLVIAVAFLCAFLIVESRVRAALDATATLPSAKYRRR